MAFPKSLSLSEWAVLGLIAQGRTHGFALGREFAPQGPVGRIWTIPRPLVYRAVSSLVARGLVVETGWATSAAAPRRRLLEASDAGNDALAAWLGEPVAHVRDARSELLIKLQLCERAGIDPSPLLGAQAASLEPMLASLRDQLERSVGFDSTILRWRLYSTEALQRFIEDLLEAHDAEHG